MAVVARLQWAQLRADEGHIIRVTSAFSEANGKLKVKAFVGAVPGVVPHPLRAFMRLSLEQWVVAASHEGIVAMDRGHRHSGGQSIFAIWFNAPAAPSRRDGLAAGPPPGGSDDSDGNDGRFDQHKRSSDQRKRSGASPGGPCSDPWAGDNDPWSAGKKPRSHILYYDMAVSDDESTNGEMERCSYPSASGSDAETVPLPLQAAVGMDHLLVEKSLSALVQFGLATAHFEWHFAGMSGMIAPATMGPSSSSVAVQAYEGLAMDKEEVNQADMDDEVQKFLDNMESLQLIGTEVPSTCCPLLDTLD